MKGLTGALVVLACLSVRFSSAQTTKEAVTPTVSNAVRTEIAELIVVANDTHLWQGGLNS